MKIDFDICRWNTKRIVNSQIGKSYIIEGISMHNFNYTSYLTTYNVYMYQQTQYRKASGCDHN